MKKLAEKAFKKGDYITPEEIKNELGYIPEGLKLLAIAKSLEDLNPDKTIKIEKGGIRFLTDNEASPYNHSMFGRHMNGMRYRNGKMLRVERKNLDEYEKSEHEHNLEVQADILAGAENGARKHLEVLPKDMKKLF